MFIFVWGSLAVLMIFNQISWSLLIISFWIMNYVQLTITSHLPVKGEWIRDHHRICGAFSNDLWHIEERSYNFSYCLKISRKYGLCFPFSLPSTEKCCNLSDFPQNHLAYEHSIESGSKNKFQKYTEWKSHSLKCTYCMILFVWNSKTSLGW